MDTSIESLESLFSHVVSQFLAQQCEIAPEKSVRGRVLFRRFRDYWNEVTHGMKYPALLGQLRVELTERGYASSGGKWPHWYGLAVRKKKHLKHANQPPVVQQEQPLITIGVDYSPAEPPQYSLLRC